MKRIIILAAALASMALVPVANASVSASYHLGPGKSTGWALHADAVNVEGYSRANPTTGHHSPMRLAVRLICQRADGSWYQYPGATVFLSPTAGYYRFAPASAVSWWYGGVGGVYLGNSRPCDTQLGLANRDLVHDRVVIGVLGNP